jgi:hypothetical protein
MQEGGGGALVLSFQDGRLRIIPVEILLELPPPAATFDEGAIAASAEIVITRNPTLSDVLALAASRMPSETGGPMVAGELYLRIRKPAAVGGRRADIPANAFAARALKPVPDRLFRGRKE